MVATTEYTEAPKPTKRTNGHGRNVDAEKLVMHRRIRMQRKELRRLNRHIYTQALRITLLKKDLILKAKDGYRHAAEIADSFPYGQKIANEIRKRL